MKIYAYLLSIKSFISFPVFATENIGADNDQLLLASCQVLTTTPEQENAKPCVYFIKGILAAARAIDSSIINKQKKKKYKPYRTKGRMPSTHFMHFCVPVDESDDRAIKTVSSQLPREIDTLKMLRDTILKVLVTEYPCNKPN